MNSKTMRGLINIINEQGDRELDPRGPGRDGLDVLDREPVIKQKNRVKRPPMYRVLIHNDDYTHAEFAAEVLQKFFNKSPEGAFRLMVEVHRQGIGVAGVYTKDVAETKITAAMDYAVSHEHPLLFTMEPDDEGSEDDV